jgi:hypothetical protein
MSQYVRILKCLMALRGAFCAGPPTYIPSVLAKLNMCDGAEGASDLHPQQVLLRV